MVFTSKMWARNVQDLNDKLNKKILVYLANPLSERYNESYNHGANLSHKYVHMFENFPNLNPYLQ